MDLINWILIVFFFVCQSLLHYVFYCWRDVYYFWHCSFVIRKFFLLLSILIPLLCHGNHFFFLLFCLHPCHRYCHPWCYCTRSSTHHRCCSYWWCCLSNAVEYENEYLWWFLATNLIFLSFWGRQNFHENWLTGIEKQGLPIIVCAYE